MDINARIAALEDEISKLEDERAAKLKEFWDLKRSQEGFYIGCVTEDDEDYHYIKVFSRLGFCSETHAKEWAEKQCADIDGIHYTGDYFEVTKMENTLYYLWESISGALKPIGEAEYCLKEAGDCSVIDEEDAETLAEFADWLEKLEDRVREVLGTAEYYMRVSR